MAKIDGIGGVFIFSNNTKSLAEWYNSTLGLSLEFLGDNVYYQEIYYFSINNSTKKLHTVLAIMPVEGNIKGKHNQAMINYRVDNLEEFVKELKKKKVTVDPIHEGPDAEGIGKFTHLFDPDGNRIELWQPSTGI